MDDFKWLIPGDVTSIIQSEAVTLTELYMSHMSWLVLPALGLFLEVWGVAEARAGGVSGRGASAGYIVNPLKTAIFSVVWKSL